MRRKVSQLVYLAAVAAVVMLGLGREVEANCGSGRQVIVGQLPDVFFTPGQTTVKTVSYTYKNIGGTGWNDCGIYARSTMTGVAVINSYGNQGREAYPPEVTGIGPATYIGAVKTWTFQIKALASAPAGSGAINIYVNNACDVCTPKYVLIGKVNVYVRSPFATSFGATATSTNTIGNSTFIDHPFTNGNRNARLLVTPNWNPPGSSGVYNNHPVGVWYDNWRGKWAIFNQDLAAMPIGAAFNVRIEGDQTVGATVKVGDFVQTATSGNTVGQSTYIAHPITDFNPAALVLFTPTWNPPGTSGGTYNNHNTGVWYDAQGKWAIFNQDLASMPTNASFNMRLIGYPGSGAFVQVASTSNTSYNYTWIDDPLTNGKPNAIILVTPNFNPNGLGGQSVNRPVGVWYDNARGKWAIFYQDRTPMPAGVAFNVLVPIAPI